LSEPYRITANAAYQKRRRGARRRNKISLAKEPPMPRSPFQRQMPKRGLVLHFKRPPEEAQAVYGPI